MTEIDLNGYKIIIVNIPPVGPPPGGSPPTTEEKFIENDESLKIEINTQEDIIENIEDRVTNYVSLKWGTSSRWSFGQN